jgi:predicted DNA-binding transcriptional regulator YafY
MAKHKHALIRYLALDRCLRNTWRTYTIDDLLNACNEAIFNHYPNSTGIQRRQLFTDIEFLRSEDGYGMDIEKKRDGRKSYYRYRNPKDSITESWLNETEAGQIKEALSVLARFKGLPQFEWISEITARLESGFALQKGAKHIIDFEQNRYLRGLGYITPLFNAILNKRALKISYKSFKSSKSEIIPFHPYFLKQFNNRWFCFGYNETYKNISNLPLDRIESIKESGLPYRINETVDFEAYFKDVVGVTVEGEMHQVLLKITKELWPYIETKPLHSTQKVKKFAQDHVLICLELKLNYEFESILLSHGEKIEILKPELLRNKLSERIKKFRYN